MANNLTLGQSAQTGKWTVSIKHGYAGINIPVTLKYNNAQPVTLNVGTAYNPVETDWVTDIGVAIDTSKITASGSVVCGETTYQIVNPVQWEAVTPASGGTAATLSISASPLNVNASGHTGVTLTIESNTGWTLESMETWATISGGTSGANNATRKLRVSENTSTSNRTVEVKVTGGGLQRSVYVVQSGVTPYIRLTGPSTVSADGGQITVSIESNTGWTLSSSANWASIVGSPSGSGSNQRNIEIDANSGQDSRALTITAYNGSLQNSITITQSGAEIQPYINLSSTATTQNVAASGASVILVVDSNTGWTLSVAQTAQSYASITSPTGSGVANKMLTISENTGASSRNIRVYAKSNDANQSITKYIDITQDGLTPELSLSANTQTISELGGNITLLVTSNTGWTITTNAQWATVSTPSGNGTDTRTLSIAAYEGTVSRECIVEVSNGSLSSSLIITQQGSKYLMFWDSDRGNLDNLAWDEAGRDRLRVDSNIEWRIFASESWVHIIDNSYQPFTGTTGNETVYVTVDNNTTGLERTATITITPVDTSLGVADDHVDVVQHKEVEKFAVFADKVMSVNGDWEEGLHELTGFTVSANTLWEVRVPVESNWISPGSGCSGRDTSEEPGGKKGITLNISPNPTVSQRTGTVHLYRDVSTLSDSCVITQGRGLSTIDIQGTASDIIFSGQTIFFTITSNTDWHLASYGNLNPASPYDLTEYTTATTFHSGTTEIAVGVPANETSGYVNYTIVVETLDNATYKVSDSYSFRQLPQPPKNGVIHAWYDNDANKSGTRHLEYYHDVPSPSGDDGRPARSASDTDWGSPFTFYVRTNTTNSAVSVECWSLKVSSGSSYRLVKDEQLAVPSNFQILDNNGNNIICGSTAGQWFGPTEDTGGTVGETWVPFNIHLPANTRSGGSGKVGNARRFIIKFKTFDYSSWQPLPGSIDANWHDSLLIEIDQYGNECYIDNYEIYAFMFGNMQQLTETATTIPAYVEGNPGRSDNCYYPSVMIQGNEHCTAYQQVTTETMDDYIKLNGNIPYTDPAVLELTSSLNSVEVHHENWNLVQYPEAARPFEVYVPANTGYTATGATKEFDLTLTYKTAIPAISKTIHVTQEYAQVTPPELTLDLYVQSIYGGQQAAVKEDDVNLLQSDRTVRFSLVGSFSEGEITYGVNGDTSKFTGQCVFGHDYFDAQTGNTQGDNFYVNQWPGHNFDAIFKVKNTVTSDFDIMITGAKTADPMVKTNLILHVHV